MKLLIISDIHSNYEALKTLDYYIDNSDMVVCLGDILGYHCDVNEVIDYLKKKKVKCILGNHDLYVIHGLENVKKELNESVIFGIDYARKIITSNNLEWLRNLMTSFSIFIENKSLLFCHGSPWDVTNEYMYSNKINVDKLSEFCFDYICYGHTHRADIKYTDNNRILINPGSVGQSRDKLRKVCAKLLDTDNMQIHDIELDYDYQKTILKCIENGASNWIYKHF